MSAPSAGGGPARGRDQNNGPRQPRPGFQMRGRGGSWRGGATAPRGRGTSANTGPKATTTSTFGGDPPQRFQLLKKKREEERKQAIRDGFLADPDKPRTLAEAITPVGTCPDKCAEFERLERIVQKDVWGQETNSDGSPDESRMVKKFRRAAAGIDEQLPSDLRPPATLKQTCDYLFDELIGETTSLATVHHFVWDRTRAIRNDFSIQQVSKPAEVTIAIDCYERIARFHILSLHQFAIPEKPYDKYDWYQEREQLDRTLLSLMQYYEDNRGRVDCKNEAEFRAYCILFQIQDPIPDLEERVSCYPENIRRNPRVRTALDLYGMACNILDPQGPLKPRAAHPLAKEDWNAFFTKVNSGQVSYLMACVAEIYFNMVRRQALNGIWRAFRRQGSTTDITDFPLDYLTDLLRFDDPDQTRNFCEHYGFGFKELPDGSDEYLDLYSVQGKTFPEASAGLSAQLFSQSVVERKRMSRTFPAVIRGYSVAQAKNEGLISEDDQGNDEDMQMDGDTASSSTFNAPKPSIPATQNASTAPSVFSGFGSNPSTASSNPFEAASPTPQTTQSSPFSFKPAPIAATGQQSTTPTGSPFAAGLKDSVFAAGKTANSSGFSGFGKPSSSPWTTPAVPSSTTPTVFGQPAQAAPQFQPQPISPDKTSQPLTSIHGTTGTNAWAKPAPSPWLKPVNTSTTSAEPPKSVFAQPSSASPTTQESSVQKSLPTFSWPANAKPAEETSTPKEAPMFSFAAPTGTAETPSAKASPFSFGQTKSASEVKTAASQSIFDAKPTEKSTFTFGAAPASAEAPATKPSFAFPSSTSTASEEKAKAEPLKVPSFTFGNAQAPKPNEAKDNSSVFTNGPSSQQTSKPFSFTAPASTSPPADQSNGPSVFQAPPSQQTQHTATAQANSSAAPTPNATKNPTFNFSNPSQPKKRSPLSQSYTADEEQATPAGTVKTVHFDTPPKSATKAPSTVVSSTPTSTPPPKVPPTPKPDLPSILEKLATEMITDADRGLLRQFVEYHARPIILSVYDQLYVEEMQELADNFRREKIAKKYGRRWRENAWKLRLHRQGREKREKRRTARRDRSAVDVAKKRRLEEDAVDDFLKRRSIRLQQDSTNGHALTNGSPPQETQAPRPLASATDVDMESVETGTTSQRDHIRGAAGADGADDEGSPDPETPAPSYESVLRRSNFLGFSMPKQRSVLGNATPRQPSRSTYFRMKAMGLNPDGTTIATSTMGPPSVNLKKRSRDEDTEMDDVSPPHKRSKTPPGGLVGARQRSSSSLSQSSIFRPSPAPSVARSYASHLDLETDPVIARARAAREALRQSTRSETPQISILADDAISVASSNIRPSTSLERARLQARLRAAERAENSLGRSTRTLDVPAYRLRESRFVPREHYGRAIERAREHQERRSGTGSLVETREASVGPSITQASMDVHAPITRSDTPDVAGGSRMIDSLRPATAPDGADQQTPLYGIGRFAELDTAAGPASEMLFTTQPSDLGAEIDTQTLSTSSYLDFGRDPTTSQASMYPNLSTSFVHPLSTAPASEAQITTMEHDIEEPQIDPSLLYAATLPALEIPESLTTQSSINTRSKTKSPILKAKQVSANPFAALVGDEEGEDESEGSASEHADDANQDEPASQPPTVVDENSLPNGSIQDAQQEPETLSKSFASITSQASTLPPTDDGPARHTRSKSREMSMSLSQKSGHLAADLVSPTQAGQHRYSLRRSPIPEVPELEAQMENEAKGDDGNDESQAVEDEEDEEDQAVEDDEDEDGDEDPEVSEDEGDDRGAVAHTAGEEADDEEERSYYSDEEAALSGEDEGSELGSQEEEDSEDEGYSREPSRGLTAYEMQQSGLVKGGTGQSAEDAFELSD